VERADQVDAGEDGGPGQPGQAVLNVAYGCAGNLAYIIKSPVVHTPADGTSLLWCGHQAEVPRAAGLLDHAVFQPLVNLLFQVHLQMWIDWSKPLVDRTLIGLCHNTVFEQRSSAVIAIEAEAGKPGRQLLDATAYRSL
jgi:hypothetical protein